MITWMIEDVPEEYNKIQEFAKDVAEDYVRCIAKPDKVMVDIRGFGRALFDCLRLNHPNIPSVGFIKTRSGMRVVEDLPPCGCDENEACPRCPDNAVKTYT